MYKHRRIRNAPGLNILDILLSGVQSFAPKVGVHLLGLDTLVVDLRSLLDIDTMGLSGDGLEERGTSTSGYMSRSC